MKLEQITVKQDLNRRLARIEGQVRGVQKMVDEDRDCREIVQQLAAIRSAVYGASQALVRDVAGQCLANMDRVDPAAREALMADLIDLLAKTG